MTLREHALQYAKDGFAVFPLEMYGKKPITENGCHDATKDLAVINDWWTNHPNSNIGIATGSKSKGLFVIDLDIDEKKGLDGISTLNEWELENGFLPETVSTITGRGGRHLFYRTDRTIGNRTGIYKGIDIRGEGGYIVAPPSIHSNGKAYKWCEANTPIMDANDLVYKFLSPVKETVNEPFQADEVIEEGSRTATLVNIVASMKGKSFPDEVIKDSVISMNTRCCIPPLTDKELEREVFPAIKRFKNGDPRYSVSFVSSVSSRQNENNEGFASFANFAITDESENPDFNNEWLPTILGSYVNGLAESLQVPPDIAGLFITGMIAISIQGKYSINPTDDWHEALNLFIAVIAESSERKTPVVSECAKPIYQFEKEENERRAPAIADYLARKEILTNQMNAVKKISSGKKGEIDTENNIDQVVGLQLAIDDLEEVYPYTAIADDITQEALARLMYENDGVLSIVSSEGGIFNMMNGKYKSTSDYDIYLKAYSAKEPVKIHRVGRPNITIENPILSIILAVQPIVINNIMNNEEMNGKGLNARFLYAKPKSKVGNRRYGVKKMDKQIINDYVNLIHRLMMLPKPNEPRTIELSEGAKLLSASFFYEIELILKDEHESPLKTWIGKLHGQTMKIAGVLHCAEFLEDSDTILLPEKTMKNAVEMGRYFLAHAKYIYKASGVSDRPEEKDAKYILKRIEERTKLTELTKPMSKREIHVLCKDKTGFEKAEYLNDGLNELVRRGYIRITKQQNPNGGRPTEIIEFSPDYLATLDKKDHARA